MCVGVCGCVGVCVGGCGFKCLRVVCACVRVYIYIYIYIYICVCVDLSACTWCVRVSLREHLCEQHDGRYSQLLHLVPLPVASAAPSKGKGELQMQLLSISDGEVQQRMNPSSFTEQTLISCRARARWHLAYTLIFNPSLIKLRCAMSVGKCASLPSRAGLARRRCS
jgi:hypothetical protein